MVEFRINVEPNNSLVWSMNGPAHIQSGPMNATLDALFYLDEMEIARYGETPVVSELEDQARYFCEKCNAVFVSRDHSYRFDRDSVQISYSFKLYDYDFFLKTVDKLGRERLDREFTKALEEKLSED